VSQTGEGRRVMNKDGEAWGTTRRLPKMLTSTEVARMLCVAPSTLCRWRSEGKGPRVYWLGVATPRYREDDVLEWLERIAA
jgi:predicted DNA-binding transcriptional regulator AlpA